VDRENEHGEKEWQDLATVLDLVDAVLALEEKRWRRNGSATQVARS
jgi:hypothetical protein